MSSTNCVIACKLTSKEFAERKQSVLMQLKQKITATSESENGYTFFFPSSTIALIEELTTFIKLEKECCSFLSFYLRIETDSIQLELLGPSGTKAFIKEEMDLLN